jgi:putative transposase
MPKRRPSPSQTWRTFLTNHVRDLVSIDFFTVPTAHRRVLFILVVLAHHRRRVLHFNVTEHPSAAWTAQQIVEAFPDDTAPACLLRDRDTIYGHAFRQRVKGMQIREILTAPRSPWQNPFAERLIGSVRRECLDHGVPRMPNREGRQCCGRDEGRPLGVGVQDQAPNPLTLRWSRASVVNGEEKAR